MSLAYSKSWCNTVTGRNIQRKRVTTVITVRIIHYWTSLELNWQFLCRCVTLESVLSAPAGSTRSLKSPLLQDGKTHGHYSALKTEFVCCSVHYYFISTWLFPFLMRVAMIHCANFAPKMHKWLLYKDEFVLSTSIQWLHSCQRRGSTPRGHKFKRWQCLIVSYAWYKLLLCSRGFGHVMEFLAPRFQTLMVLAQRMCPETQTTLNWL